MVFVFVLLIFIYLSPENTFRMISPVLIIRAQSRTSPMLTCMPLLPNPVVIWVMSQIQISMIYSMIYVGFVCFS